MRQVLQYPGAKNRIADWICGHMPEHTVYLELFCGSASILLNKPRCHIETINDLDGEVVNFFRVLRDYPEELAERLYFTPFARAEYIKGFEAAGDPIEQARRYCVLCWQGFGNSQVYQNGFKTGQQSKSPNPAKGWRDLPEIVIEAANRLRGVQIEHLPALELLQRYNTPDVFVYADPPYLPELRKKNLYKKEMEEGEHIELLKALQNHPGPVMLSGFNSSLYNTYLQGWYKASRETQAECGIRRTETIWMNYKKEEQLTLFDIKEAATC